MTIQDVADEAGVSRAAVSKVIRDAYGVSTQMRQRVEAAIDRLGYRPRVAARVMRGSSFTLGLEIPQIGNDFHSMVVAGATEALAGTPYQLIVAPIRDPLEGDRAIQSLADRQVDGVITIAPLVSAEWLEDYATDVPLVMVGRHDRSAKYDTVAGDDTAGAEQVMRHLLDLGHRHIAFLATGGQHPEVSRPNIAATDRDPPAIRQRVYREQMALHGLTSVVGTSAGHLEKHAVDAARRLLDHSPRPTAIFAAHDTLALGMLRALDSMSLGAPEVSVVGFDDIPIASHPLISLTSVDQQGDAMGREAVRLLLERIAGRSEAVHLQLPVTLRTRGSTAPPPGA